MAFTKRGVQIFGGVLMGIGALGFFSSLFVPPTFLFGLQPLVLPLSLNTFAMGMLLLAERLWPEKWQSAFAVTLAIGFLFWVIESFMAATPVFAFLGAAQMVMWLRFADEKNQWHTPFVRGRAALNTLLTITSMVLMAQTAFVLGIVYMPSAPLWLFGAEYYTRMVKYTLFIVSAVGLIIDGVRQHRHDATLSEEAVRTPASSGEVAKKEVPVARVAEDTEPPKPKATTYATSVEPADPEADGKAAALGAQ